MTVNMNKAAITSRQWASIALLCGFSISLPSFAELKPMDDAALEETTGQAYIKMDSYQQDSNQVSRVTFGQTVKVQANADSLILGNGGINGAGVADINATNFSLGYIDTATNQIVPFEFTNPYFEWSTDALNNVTGFRIGFEDAKGVLQMDLTSFSGNIDMTINGQAASLFTGVGGSTTNTRATYIGDSTGSCTDGVDCVALSNIQSLSVADSDSTGTADFFLSFQKAAMNWQTSAGTQNTGSGGFFMNVPTDNTLTISDANSGTAGLAVEFIDRGVGRWNN